MPEIRTVKIEDAERFLKCLIEIWKSLREWLPASFVNPELEIMLKPETIEELKRRIESKDSIFLVAEESGEIVGLARGREYAGVCHLGFLGVKKEYRGRGIGQSLLNRFIEEARKRKAHKVWLFTSPNLLPAIRLYIKEGFVPEGFLRKHNHGLDMIIYSKFL